MEESKNPGWHASQGEHFKSLFDYLKHVSTLATGSILIVATFLEKVFKAPINSWAVGVSMGALLLCLLTSLVAYSLLVLNYPRADRRLESDAESSVERNAIAIGLVGTWLTFGVGIGSMTYFFLTNWYHGQ